MDIPPLRPSIDPSSLQPEDLARSPHLTEEAKVKELARQFEAILLRQILHDSQKTIIKSEFADDSVSGSIYQDMVTTQLAESISRSGSFGFAQSLEHQLTRQALRSPAATPPSDAP